MTDQELVAALAPALPGRAIVGLERRPSPYRTSFALEEVDLLTDDGARLELMLKPAAWSDLSEEARRVRPRFLHDPRRELAVYREILGPCGIGAPALLAAAGDGGWIAIERLRADALYEVGEPDAWVGAAAWAGRLHAALAPRAAALAGRAGLARHDAASYRVWMERARRFRPHADLELLAAGHDRLAEELAALPRTVVHGELYPANVLVERTGGRPEIRVVDWERAGHGPGLLDLAALTGGGLDPDVRVAMVAAYREAAGASAPGRGAFERALEACRLHLALQWLGWSADWSPPPEHAQDWLAEALASARRLRILPR
ncbi:MAG: hypothetical protein QOD86_756 [Miltoncostaeaceae bacterium]|nr:hypothetical protein [Miltoncostaeaceae bacterium]